MTFFVSFSMTIWWEEKGWLVTELGYVDIGAANILLSCEALGEWDCGRGRGMCCGRDESGCDCASGLGCVCVFCCGGLDWVKGEERLSGGVSVRVSAKLWNPDYVSEDRPSVSAIVKALLRG